MAKIGRNSPCPCGSGRKYKRCCLRKDREARRERLEHSQSQVTTETTVVASKAPRAQKLVHDTSLEDVLAMRVPLPEGQGGNG